MHDDKVIVNLLDRSPENGDIVLINACDSYTLEDDGTVRKGSGVGDIIVKRVIAKGGQTIDIDFTTGTVYVDDAKLREDYVKLGLTHADGGAFTGQYPVTVPEGYIFVMGDHRSVSKDSRSSQVGPIAKSEVKGKVRYIVFPFRDIGKVE